jgi:hypothetical protein
LGAPYVVTGFDEGSRAIGMPTGSTSYLIINFRNGVPADLPARLVRLQERWPELSARTGDEFSYSSSQYWQGKTGAGAAILLAALLAALLMGMLLIGGIGRFLQRRQADLTSLIGHGAGSDTLVALVAGVSVFIGIGALAITVLVVPAAMVAGRPFLPWVATSPVDALFALLMTLTCTAVASVSGVRSVLRVSSDVIFRA